MIPLHMYKLTALAIGTKAIFIEFCALLRFVFLRKKVFSPEFLLAMGKRTLNDMKVTSSEKGHSVLSL